MKKAVIVVGKRNAGKSTTIRKFLDLADEKLGRNEFKIDGKNGFTWITSFEEYDRDPDETVEEKKGYEFLVFASWGLGLLPDVHNALEKRSFTFKDVHVHHFSEVPERAKEIVKFFKSVK